MSKGMTNPTNPPVTAEQIEPCPFCGNEYVMLATVEAGGIQWDQVECGQCDAVISGGSDVVERWNTLAMLKAHKPAEQHIGSPWERELRSMLAATNEHLERIEAALTPVGDEVVERVARAICKRRKGEWANYASLEDRVEANAEWMLDARAAINSLGLE